MAGKIFGILQRVGRSFMLPIAILPVAGLLLGIGQSFTNETMLRTYHLMNLMGPGTVLYAILKILGDCGNIIFENMPLLFAVGVSIGMARSEKEVAALSGIVAFFIMHTAISAMITLNGGSQVLHRGAIDDILGIKSLQMGVFGGIIVGLGVAVLHNKFYKIKLPDVISFFGGTRFVPIICTVVYIFVGIIMFFIWPPIQNIMYELGNIVRASGYFGTFIYGVMERALIPFGLHHVFYLPFWQTSLGGAMKVAGKTVEGAQNIFFAQLADSSTRHFSVEATRFMAGKFPLMIFGLPGAALAMYQCAKPEKKKLVGGLFASAALTTILTGITEPLEFMFLFVAPGLYAIHCLLAGMSFMLMHILKVCVGMTFSGGMIDMFLFGILQGQEKTNWMMFVPVGILYFILYYFLFHFLILKFHIKTPGREEKEEISVYPVNQSENVPKEKEVLSKTAVVSEMIVQGLGGAQNIKDIDCCVTRLRCTVRDPALVKDEILRKSGARGVMKKGDGVQIIYGPLVTVIKSNLEDYLNGNDMKETEEETMEQRKKMMEESKEVSTEYLFMPIHGTVIELSEVDDQVFSAGMLGEGFAIQPLEGKVFAPADGVISALFDTKHAIAINSVRGAEILIHVGLDTVRLGGKYFNAKVESGMHVKKGDLLLEFDLEKIKKAGYRLTTPVVVSNSISYTSITLDKEGKQPVGEEILTLKK
ncbi:PTS transporter subunit IIABC [Anaerostipes sp. MSJ-23]|uniref:PTS transporter subunit IIABC n=1 Tax=Anaerostipes sp. MSJ-23 TaxID=2841520 RepID=UPI001C121E31|nr:PTS transporter subunit IIABC [Anaerostipes sp. MSJ-23]MBU5460566.1 glucose PTS transporter subunit IIA [Anaerostipes sp. MSJ-23]